MAEGLESLATVKSWDNQLFKIDLGAWSFQRLARDKAVFLFFFPNPHASSVFQNVTVQFWCEVSEMFYWSYTWLYNCAAKREISHRKRTCSHSCLKVTMKHKWITNLNKSWKKINVIKFKRGTKNKKRRKLSKQQNVESDSRARAAYPHKQDRVSFKNTIKTGCKHRLVLEHTLSRAIRSLLHVRPVVLKYLSVQMLY